MMRRILFLFFLLCGGVLAVVAQRISGRVYDAKTGESLPFVNVFYDGGKGGVQTDLEGRFSLPFRHNAKLLVSSVGYETFSLRLKSTDSLMVKLKPADLGLSEATVKGSRGKYSRKNNPAVILMEKVIAAKKASNLRQHDYYSVDKYDKISFALSVATLSHLVSVGVVRDSSILLCPSDRGWSLCERDAIHLCEVFACAQHPEDRVETSAVGVPIQAKTFSKSPRLLIATIGIGEGLSG